MNVLGKWLGVALVVVGLMGCSSPAPQERGEAGALHHKARVLSLAPSTTEILYAIGAGDDVIGVTDFCAFPPEAKAMPKFGGFHNPNVEAMIAARPTIAFHATGTRGLEDQLTAAGIAVVSVPSDRLSDIAGGLRIAGKALDRADAAEREALAFEAAIARLRAACSEQPRVRVLVVLSRTPGPVREVFSVGPNTFIDDLLQVIGAENALRDSPAPYPQPSLEEIIVRPPEVILEETSNVDADSIARSRAEWAQALGPQSAKVRVEVFSDPHLSVPGPGVIRSAERLARLVHPALVLEASGS